jgi:hypothetical protein
MNLIEAQQIHSMSKFREFAYKNEADPLFHKLQRGEATQEQWLAKIEEIKQRYPYLTEGTVEEAQAVIDAEIVASQVPKEEKKE